MLTDKNKDKLISMYFVVFDDVYNVIYAHLHFSTSHSVYKYKLNIILVCTTGIYHIYLLYE